MDRRSFQELLVRTGSYDTVRDAGARSIRARMFGWSDVYYYWRLFLVIYSGHRIAKRGLFDAEAWADHSYGVLRAVEDCGGRVAVSGMESVVGLGGRPVVYVSNHMGLLETLFFPVILLRFNYLTTVVKQSLMKYPVFGSIMRAVEPITVSRENARDDLKDVMRKGREFLDAGRSVLIFPQSTRSTAIDPSDFNSLGVKLAQRANVPVVPVAVKTDFHGIGRLMRDVGRIDRSKILRFKFGVSCGIDGNGREAHRATVEFIMNALQQWGCRVDGGKNDTGPAIESVV